MSEIVAKLREYNRWRRGDEGIAQPDPGEIGRLLDAVCEMVDADTNRPKMSAPTPETDNLARGNHVVPTEWAEQLERERDEALMDRANGDIATMTINHYERILRERDMAEDERIDLAKQLRSEQERHAVCQNKRDEARAQVKELIYIADRAIDLAAIDFENDKFGVVSELRYGLDKIKEGAK